jgi:hypothetical protein
MSTEVSIQWKMTALQNSVAKRMWRLCDVTVSRAARTLISHGLKCVQAVEGVGGIAMSSALFGSAEGQIERVLTVRLSREMAEVIVEWHGRIRVERRQSPQGRVGTAAGWLLSYGSRLLDAESDGSLIRMINEHSAGEKRAGIGPGRRRSEGWRSAHRLVARDTGLEARHRSRLR